MNKKELKQQLARDKELYKERFSTAQRKFYRITNNIEYVTYRTICLSRVYHFLKNKKRNIFETLRLVIVSKRLNKFSQKGNYQLNYKSLGDSIIIYHPNVITNSNCVIGNFVRFHGNNCIGNNGTSEDAPIIGNNVDIGFGSSVIGGVIIADDVTIGAHTLVTKSCEVRGAILVGSPAVIKRIKSLNE